MDAFAAEPELAKTASKRDVFYAFRPKSYPFAASYRVFEILFFSQYCMKIMLGVE